MVVYVLFFSNKGDVKIHTSKSITRQETVYPPYTHSFPLEWAITRNSFYAHTSGPHNTRTVQVHVADYLGQTLSRNSFIEALCQMDWASSSDMLRALYCTAALQGCRHSVCELVSACSITACMCYNNVHKHKQLL